MQKVEDKQLEEVKTMTSPFDEVKDMNYTAAVNILIQAGKCSTGCRGSFSKRFSFISCCGRVFNI